MLVVGAGIAGLSSAVMASRAGLRCEVWEASSRAGGLLEPVEFLGLPCDRGSHRVHVDACPELFDLTRGATWEPRARRGVLVLGGRHLPYPLEAVSFARALGARAVTAMGVGWALRPRRFERFRAWERDRGAHGHDEGFEDFVLARAGSVAYERFYRPYVEKVWGVAPSHLSRSVARQRLSTASPWRSLLGALRPSSVTPTFLYPRGGTSSLIDALLTDCARSDVTVRYDRAVKRDDIASLPFDRVLFTGGVASLAPDAGLTHRGLYLVHVALPPGTLADVDTWYVPDARYWFGRVSQPARFSPSLATQSADVLAIEIPEGRWGEGRDFTRDLGTLMSQLRDAGIVRTRSPPLDARQTWISGVYPMYLRGWSSRWAHAMERVRAMERVMPVGRQGLFLHCNMDHAVKIARDAVEHIARGASASEWIDGCARYLEMRVRD